MGLKIRENTLALKYFTWKSNHKDVVVQRYVIAYADYQDVEYDLTSLKHKQL